jgi:acetyltransferase-like isoleucine patch superfamily enzyme
MKQKEYKPYYNVSKNVEEQIKKSSRRHNETVIIFILKKFLNYLLSTMAYNCPFNSWRIKFHRWRGVTIGKNVMIGFRVTLDHSYPDYIFIDDNVSLAGNNYILAHSNPYPHFEHVLPSFVAPVVIKKGAWIGINTTILPGITIGEFAVVATGSVVTKDVPEKVMVAGVPAKIIKVLDLTNQ